MTGAEGIEQFIQQLMTVFVLPVAGSLAALIVAWAAYKVTVFVNLRDQQHHVDTLERALDHAIAIGQLHVKARPMTNEEVIREIQGIAYDYVVTHSPEALRAMGVDVKSRADQVKLMEKISARLAPAVLIAQSSAEPEGMSVAAASTIANRLVDTGPLRVYPGKIEAGAARPGESTR